MAEELDDICGYIFMQKSPSCGLERVKVYDGPVPAKEGRGLFAESLISRLPDLPVEEEGRLVGIVSIGDLVKAAEKFRQAMDDFGDDLIDCVIVNHSTQARRPEGWLAQPVEVDVRGLEEAYGLLGGRSIRRALNPGADPANVLALDDIALMTGYDVRPVVASREDIAGLVSRLTRLDDLQFASPALTITDAGLSRSVNIRGVPGWSSLGQGQNTPSSASMRS